jgi:hypothetical protein
MITRDNSLGPHWSGAAIDNTEEFPLSAVLREARKFEA